MANVDLGWGLCFEVGIGVFALLCGNFTRMWPAERLSWPISTPILLIGLVTALPPMAVILGIRRFPWRVCQELSQMVDTKVWPMFRHLNIAELALISIAAGWGEELLFRGLIQAELTQRFDVLTGIAVASLVFAVMHCLSPAYFAMAFLISIYFGWLFWHFDSLWVPILGHATYDFLMLLIMRYRDRGHS